MENLHYRQGGILLGARKLGAVLVALAVPLLLGAWKDIVGRGINRTYVERIQDGKTKKPEILTWFGDPHEVKRTPEGVIYIYQTFRPKSDRPRKDTREIRPAADTPYHLEQNLQMRSTKEKEGPTKELESRLTIRFKPDGETVQSHEYREF